MLYTKAWRYKEPCHIFQFCFQSYIACSHIHNLFVQAYSMFRILIGNIFQLMEFFSVYSMRLFQVVDNDQGCDILPCHTYNQQNKSSAFTLNKRNHYNIKINSLDYFYSFPFFFLSLKTLVIYNFRFSKVNIMKCDTIIRNVYIHI